MWGVRSCLDQSFSKCGINLVKTYYHAVGRFAFRMEKRVNIACAKLGNGFPSGTAALKKQFGFSYCSSLAFPVPAVSNVGFQHLIRATLPLWQCFIGKPARLTIRVLWFLFLIVKSEVKKQIGRRCHCGSVLLSGRAGRGE